MKNKNGHKQILNILLLSKGGRAEQPHQRDENNNKNNVNGKRERDLGVDDDDDTQQKLSFLYYFFYLFFFFANLQQYNEQEMKTKRRQFILFTHKPSAPVYFYKVCERLMPQNGDLNNMEGK